MFTGEAEKLVSRILAWGASATTLFLITGSVTDPVNAPKLFLVGGLAISILMVMLKNGIKSFGLNDRLLTITIMVFLFGLVVAVFASSSPLSQNLYGTFGRNTGLLTYLCFTLILLASSNLREEKSFKSLMQGLFFAGTANVIYSAYVLAYSDPVGWNNPYGAILGTFGNPNFISSFLGMYISGTISLTLSSKLSVPTRIISLLFGLVAFYEIASTNSIQGYVVAIAGSAFVIFLKVRSLGLKYLEFSYLSFVALIGILAVAGIFQNGPLGKFLYQGTTAFRAQYWKAAVNMGLSHPFTGVGMDSYGDYYRMQRDMQALKTPGVQVVSNSAHNVVLDFFASGGFLLAISYLVIIVISTVSAVRVVLRNREFDHIFSVLATSWLGYQLQSLISINQIGLAIWGWLLSGALIGYEKATRKDTEVSSLKKPKQMRISKRVKNEVFSAGLMAGIGSIIGFLLVAPPLAADMAWAKTTKSGNLPEIEKTFVSSYLRPLDSSRLVNFVALLESNQFYDLALKYSLMAVEFNPNNFDSWNTLFSIKNSTAEQKALALQNMKRLDPLNSELDKL